jgi:hypothetical protein
MKTRFLFSAALVCLLSIGTLAQEIYVDYNRSQDFSKFRTYAWGEQPNANEIRNPFLAQAAREQIDAELAQRGLQKVEESANPDLIVVAGGGAKQQTSYNVWGTGGWRYGGGSGSITPQTDVIGTLVVDLYDANAKQMVWRGAAQGTLDEKNSEKNQKLVKKAVTKMFKKYPAGEDKK